MIEKGAFSKRRLKISFKKKRIWATAFIVIGYSISFYLFFLFWREMLRYQTLNEYGEMMVLTPVETYFYNFFYAGLAILTGLSFGAYSLFATQFRLPGQVRHTITNNFSGLQWYFVYIITKLGVFYGIFSWSGELYLFVSLYEEFWFLFPLILIVLALHQWIKIRVFFRNSFKLMILSLTGVILFAGILAAIPFFDYKPFNHSVLKQTVGYNYTIDLPHAESSTGLERRYLTQDLFLGYPKTGMTDSTIVIVANNLKTLNKAEIVSWIQESKNTLDEFEIDQFTISLKADKNTKIGSIQNIIEILRELNVRQFYFMTTQRQGIRMYKPPIFSEFTEDTSNWHPSYSDFLDARKNLKIIRIGLVNNQFYLSDSIVSKAEIQPLLENLLKENQGKYLIDITADYESTYQNLIVIIDQIRLSIIQLRKDFAHKHFSKEYDFLTTAWEDRPLNDTLSLVYPFEFHFPNEKEREYLRKNFD